MPSLFSLILSVCLLAFTLLYLFHSHAVRFQPDSRHSLDSRPRDARTLSANAAMARPKWSEDIDIVCYDEERLERLAYGSGPGAEVRGYPAKGGLYVLQKASSVEVEFLGFDRFDTEASSDADTEEALCDNMRRLGAVWWKTQYDYVMSRIGARWPKVPPLYMLVGWPAGGGIWVFNATEPYGKGAGIIHNAYSMEERCKLIERLGGTFYENPKDCADLDLP